MPILNDTDRSESIGMTEHQYASRHGWQIGLEVSPSMYLKLCKTFNTMQDLSEYVDKCIKRKIKINSLLYRFFGRKVDNE